MKTLKSPLKNNTKIDFFQGKVESYPNIGKEIFT